jgi:UTP--glucose-1-phosphate uridylyltransferase
LMNSFSTGKDTAAALSALKPSKEPIPFFQHRFPKVLRKNLKPAAWPASPQLEWNPPGHGDIYPALQSSGMLKRLLDTGIHYAFISNVDNLGARMSARLLGYFVENQFPFMMEVAEKTPADIKGGHLARYRNGRLLLREAAQCPADEVDAFQDIQRYGFFNTNSIWVNLESLNTVLKKHRIIDLPMILNPKTLDPRDETSPPVYQIETAMGAAISLFEGATAVKVPRSRFAPVKTCNDLLAVRSDCYEYTADETLRLSPKRNVDKAFDTVKIKLDPRYYGKIDLLEERFKQGEPSLVNCESLTIEGDVHFERNVSIKGQVFIRNTGDSPAIIKEGTVIDRDIQF